MTGRRRERGAVAVEAALVTPLVLALIFGIIESAFLMKDVLAASSAVRAGVRIASAQPRTTDFAQAAANEVAKRSEAINKNAIEQLWVYKVAADSDKPIGRQLQRLHRLRQVRLERQCLRQGVRHAGLPPTRTPARVRWAARRTASGSTSRSSTQAFTGLVFNTIDDLGEQHPEPGTDPRSERLQAVTSPVSGVPRRRRPAARPG